MPDQIRAVIGLDIGTTEAKAICLALDGRQLKQAKVTAVEPQRLRFVLTEGRNRQIRRTFAALGYRIESLHRTHFGDYVLGALPAGEFQSIIENVA